MFNRNSTTLAALAAALFSIVLSSNAAHAQASQCFVLAKLPYEQNIAMVGMQVFIAVWIFVLGSCFGSFLNVVIYRMPEGLSLGKPKSRCPRCETSLAARDNIPVLGWLLLKGKCRYCSLPIAPRYPIIEAVCGLTFLILMFGELLNGAANLPLRRADVFHVNQGFWLVWFAKWDLSGMYFFHCCMLVVVLATVMIGYDGHKPQRKLIAFSLLVAVICGTMWPAVRPVPAFPWPESLAGMRSGVIWQDLMQPPNRYWTGVTLVGLLDGVVGILGGLIFGSLISFSLSAKKQAEPNFVPATVMVTFVIVGSFLGWQATGILAILMLLLVAMTKLAAKVASTCCPQFQVDRIVGPLLFMLLFVLLLSWQRLNAAVWMIGVNGWNFGGLNWWQDWLVTLVAIAGLSAVLHQVPIRETISEPLVEVELGDQIDSTSPSTTES